jgi:hypothetical protein
MDNAVMIEKQRHDMNLRPGFVLVEVSAEEATQQVSEGVYVVSEPTPEHRKALFESQYC